MNNVQAKVTKDFNGVPDGQTVTRRLHVGQIITGDLARAAIQGGLAQRVETGEPDRTKGKEPARTATAPKSGAVSQRGRASTKAKPKKSEKPA